MRTLPLLTALALASCQPPPAGPTTPATPPTPALGSEVTALGVASEVRNPALARRVASARAIQRLGRLQRPLAIAFSYQRVAGASRLETRLIQASREGALETSFETRAGQVVCLARARRTAAEDARRARLASSPGEGAARGANLAVALQLAESRALRAALAGSLEAEAGWVKGELTLLEVNESLADEGVLLKLRVEIVVRERGSLGREQQRAVLEAALGEHREQHEWGPAADRLQALFALEPTRLEHLKAELEAVERIPDAERAAKLRRRLQRLEAKSPPPLSPSPPLALQVSWRTCFFET